MKEKRYGTYEGLTVPVQIFESYQEADAEAGRVDAMLDCGNDNAVYRGGPLNEAREKVIELLEEASGLARNTKDSGKKDEAGNAVLVVDEKNDAFIARAMAKLGWQDLTSLQPKLDEWAATAGDNDTALAISLKQRERKTPQPKTVAKEFIETATKILANGPDFIGKWYAAKVQPYGLAMPALTDTPENNAKVLGKLIKDVMAAKQKAEMASLVG